MARTVSRRKAPTDRITVGYDFPLVLRIRPALDISEDQFFEFCQLNGDLRIERTAEGELLIMPPTGWDAGARNAEITRQLGNWAMRDGTGVASDSSTGFRLPNTAVRAPDAAWIPRSRLDQIPAAQRGVFLPACPDFVLELRSASDRLRDVQAKMQEYIANGARLGWLIDPESRRVYVYRPDAPVQRLDRPESVSGDPVLPGFVLDLRQIW
jgi:Uma2 family endonuclease